MFPIPRRGNNSKAILRSKINFQITIQPTCSAKKNVETGSGQHKLEWQKQEILPVLYIMTWILGKSMCGNSHTATLRSLTKEVFFERLFYFTRWAGKCCHFGFLSVVSHFINYEVGNNGNCANSECEHNHSGRVC